MAFHLPYLGYGIAVLSERKRAHARHRPPRPAHRPRARWPACGATPPRKGVRSRHDPARRPARRPPGGRRRGAGLAGDVHRVRHECRRVLRDRLQLPAGGHPDRTGQRLGDERHDADPHRYRRQRHRRQHERDDQDLQRLDRHRDGRADAHRHALGHELEQDGLDARPGHLHRPGDADRHVGQHRHQQRQHLQDRHHRPDRHQHLRREQGGRHRRQDRERRHAHLHLLRGDHAGVGVDRLGRRERRGPHQVHEQRQRPDHHPQHREQRVGDPPRQRPDERRLRHRNDDLQRDDGHVVRRHLGRRHPRDAVQRELVGQPRAQHELEAQSERQGPRRQRSVDDAPTPRP